MNVGDVVMFTNQNSRYAKWFLGQIGEIQSCGYASSGCLHFRIKWMQPIQYFDGFATISDFAAKNFEVYNENA
tara:strand:+ start:12 stop:230 length:219 start_codon:yes stop_codon:yes gene_type:complete